MNLNINNNNMSKLITLVTLLLTVLVCANVLARHHHHHHNHHHHGRRPSSQQQQDKDEYMIRMADGIYYISELEKATRKKSSSSKSATSLSDSASSADAATTTTEIDLDYYKKFADEETGEVQVFVTFRSKLTPKDWTLVPHGEYIPKHTVSLLTNVSHIATLMSHPRVRHVSVLPSTTKYSTNLMSLDFDSQELLADMNGLHEIEESRRISAENKRIEALEFLIFPGDNMERSVRKWADEAAQLLPFLQKVEIKPVSAKKIVAEFKFPSLESRMANREKLIDFIAKKNHIRHVQITEDFYMSSRADADSLNVATMGMDHFLSEYASNPKSPSYQAMLDANYAKLGVHSLTDVQMFWKWNITGKGYVVGIGDTGIDMNHCMFRDSQNPKPVTKTYGDEDIENMRPVDGVNTKHRKVAQYWAYADGGDVAGGHGSHVVGVLAGSIEGSDNKNIHTGVLPDAKLAFIDIGLPDKSLKMPEDLAEAYFPFMKKMGAEIFSNSWGNKNYGAYSLAAREIDYYMWKNPYTLALFAAGNSGREGAATITAPGTAKNCLTVGSSEASATNFKVGIPLYSDLMRANVPCDKSSFLYSMPEFCGDRPVPCNDRKTVALTCKAIKDGGRLAEDICCKVPYLNKMCCSKFLLQKNLKQLNPFSDEYSDKNVAVFSSRGPTNDGRIKPDVVSIGQPIFSARAHGEIYQNQQCPIPQVMQGTSQSTPIVAGYCVMIKEYMKTLYDQYANVKGAEQVQQAQRADYKQGKVYGSLLKAIVINSGSELTGVVDINGQGVIRKLNGFPSFTQGFGNVNLTTIMPSPQSSKFMFAHQDAVETGDQKKYCFHTTRGLVRKVTLVWTDFPASPSALTTLVNNLDLAVQLSDGSEVLGNNARPGAPDDVNNVEQIMLAKPQEYLKVIVRGSDVPHGPQPFALVVTGEGETRVSEC